ncbi:hypothetical protein D8674_020187 [Pyrus ussuriensis x Pyrus communis]|uniref:Uncharacterized protein n=1 Tax=Pyrus ussuriensis x Pyrus communis TaxID=2448454 RepID=A0A5N5HEY5_9ROSA|nr:hypothetical protein D8674_020187 [Pyrus ussuriensis x Pyrus communis]
MLSAGLRGLLSLHICGAVLLGFHRLLMVVVRVDLGVGYTLVGYATGVHPILNKAITMDSASSQFSNVV